MGIFRCGSILVTVALLLNPTFADVLVQPGYGQPKSGGVKNSVSQKQEARKNPQVGNSQQQNVQNLLQQQHAMERQYLQQKHQNEQNQLLQLQQQYPQTQILGSPYGYPVAGGNEVVGTPWGYHAPYGGKLFSLGPFGLHSLALGGLGGLGGAGFPLLLSTHQGAAYPMPESGQYQKSMDLPTQPRAKRDINRNFGESSGRKYGEENLRTRENGVAANQALKTNFVGVPSNSDLQKTNGGEDVVGSNLLDPFGLIDKTEDVLEDLRSGHLPNLLPNFLGGGNSQKPVKFDEHVVGDSNQHQYAPGKSNSEYSMTNQLNNQSQKSGRAPIVGDSKHDFRYYPAPMPGHFPPPLSPFGAYPPPTYPTYGPYMRNSNVDKNSMAYRGNPMIGNSNPVSAHQQNSMKSSNYLNDQITGSQNPVGGKASGFNDPIITSQNPLGKLSSGDITAPGGYDQIVGSPMQIGELHDLARAVKPILGTLINPMTGSSSYAALSGGGMPFNYLYGGARAMGGYPGAGSGRHYFDLDDIFDDRGFNHLNHHGGYNTRIYETFVDDPPYGYGNGFRPHMHSQGYIY